MRKYIKMMFACLLLVGCSNSSKVENTQVNEMGCKVASVSSLGVNSMQVQVHQGGFDTYVKLTAYVSSVGDFQKYWDVVLENWLHYDKLFDKYDTYEGVNNIKTINDNAGIQPVQVEDDLFELLVLSKEYYEKTNGAFDITLGPVLSIWHNYREEGQKLNEQGLSGNLPTLEELQEANKHVGWDKIELDEKNKTVYITDSLGSIDVGGVAKGFSAEKIVQKLECAGMASGILDAGGNLRTINYMPSGEAWTIGITNPNDYQDDKSYEAIEYKGSMSFVTSGDYLRYYTVDGVNYNHIISPFTLYPATNFRSVSINTKNSGLADIYSTSSFIMSYEDGLAFSNSEGFDAIWIVDKENALDVDSAHSEIIDISEDIIPIQVVANESAKQKMHYLKLQK